MSGKLSNLVGFVLLRQRDSFDEVLHRKSNTQSRQEQSPEPELQVWFPPVPLEWLGLVRQEEQGVGWPQGPL